VYQLRSRPKLLGARNKPCLDHSGGTCRVRPPATAGPQPAVRPTRRGPQDILGRCHGRHHRVRLTDGRDVHWSQFLQNVLNYGTEQAGAAILPAPILMVLVAPRSAKMVESRGSRPTLLLGYASSHWVSCDAAAVARGLRILGRSAWYALVGIGCGIRRNTSRGAL